MKRNTGYVCAYGEQNQIFSHTHVCVCVSYLCVCVYNVCVLCKDIFMILKKTEKKQIRGVSALLSILKYSSGTYIIQTRLGCVYYICSAKIN